MYRCVGVCVSVCRCECLVHVWYMCVGSPHFPGAEHLEKVVGTWQSPKPGWSDTHSQAWRKRRSGSGKEAGVSLRPNQAGREPGWQMGSGREDGRQMPTS